MGEMSEERARLVSIGIPLRESIRHARAMKHHAVGWGVCDVEDQADIGGSPGQPARTIESTRNVLGFIIPSIGVNGSEAARELGGARKVCNLHPNRIIVISVGNQRDLEVCVRVLPTVLPDNVLDLGFGLMNPRLHRAGAIEDERNLDDNARSHSEVGVLQAGMESSDPFSGNPDRSCGVRVKSSRTAVSGSSKFRKRI